MTPRELTRVIAHVPAKVHFTYTRHYDVLCVLRLLGKTVNCMENLSKRTDVVYVFVGIARHVFRTASHRSLHCSDAAFLRESVNKMSVDIMNDYLLHWRKFSISNVFINVRLHKRT